jgi:hypothetical protein
LTFCFQVLGNLCFRPYVAKPQLCKIKRRDIEIDEIMKKDAYNGCFREIDSKPHRINLKDKYKRKAQGIWLKLAISNDLHSRENPEYIKH